MRAARIPVFVLALTLAAILCNSVHVTRLSHGWTEAAQSVSSAALRSDMTAAAQALDTLETRWQRQQPYLQLVISHTALDETDLLLTRVRALCVQGDSAELYAAAQELESRLTLLAQSQQVRWGNIW